MQQECRVLHLVLASGVAVFWNWKSLRVSCHLTILAVGLFTLWTGFVVTIVEGLVFPDLLNMAEYALYALGSAVVVFRCWKTFGKKRRPA